jgi:class 3 adenylate cyclase
LSVRRHYVETSQNSGLFAAFGVFSRDTTLVAKFLRVGVHHSNVSGYTSKAWTIRRIGSTVLLKWGSVEVRRAGPGRRIYWAGRPRQKTVRCGSEKRALDYVKRAIARRRGHRYERLLETMRIRPRLLHRRVEPDRVLATVLFVDIVRSTEKAALLGDRRWNEVLSHYYAALRRELRASRGREVTTTGDGMLATFDGKPGAARAIRCAAAIRQAVRTLGLEIRAGLHAGECELVGDAVGGIAVHIGARVMARAGADEVLVSSTVKDLVVGSGIEFEYRALIGSKACPRVGAYTGYFRING